VDQDLEQWITLSGAEEHNLRGIDARIPRGALTVITGVSGSGKSSLAFDTLFREGQRRFLETLPAFTRQAHRVLARARVASIRGLGPAVAIGQRAGLSNPRSTVGTLTEVWDLLRLLFARLGVAPEGVRPTRGLFSFNGAEGACPTCAGLGVEDRLDLGLIVKDPARSLREGALSVSTPNGYLMYSQVTLEVLDQVLQAHGGSVDIPWKDLSEEVRNVVFHGSERLRIPFGKHSLESRLKWTGITARPRQEGFYRGLVTVMEEILRGKRNDSILRFVRSVPCPACGGSRLGEAARSVTFQGRSITDLARLPAPDLQAFLDAAPGGPVLDPIREDLRARTTLLEELGLDYLAFDRPAPTLSLGEAQRLRLLNLAMGELRGLVLVLDEPSAGLHPADATRLLGLLRRLRDRGQTVVAVEHDPTLALGADWILDLGPGPGAEGGRVLYSGPPSGLVRGGDTPSERWIQGAFRRLERRTRKLAPLPLAGLTRNNLHGLDAEILEGGLNVVTGVSGAGKTSFLEAAVEALAPRRIVRVDASPIGRTPRSNPATYTGAFDLIRDLFAATPEAKALGLAKGHFTFNTPGGRCEACEGAGVVEVGMKHLGTVATVCEACGGSRFHPDVLSVRWHGRNIKEVLDGSVQEAAVLFRDHPRLTRILSALLDCGLGHLPLGQSATTLSGGEAQRVKLASELARAGKGGAILALDEPTTGLHAADTAVLLAAWDRLTQAGHTLLVVDNDPTVILRADRVLDLGPGSGPRGGTLVVSGTPEAVAACPDSVTGRFLMTFPPPLAPPSGPAPAAPPPMELRGVTTHNLRGLDAAIPARGLTVVTGPSGSGKSSLVFDTLLAESRNRFNDLVAPWARRLLPRAGGAEFVAAEALQAAVAVPPATGRRNPRSRVGTVTEVDELLRLLYSRAGTPPEGCGPLPASAFSSNSEAGACARCRGLGFIQACDPERLVTHPGQSLLDGALDGTRYGAYLGERDGRFLAILAAACEALGLDLTPAWRDLDARTREVAMLGCGERVFQVDWRYRRGRVEGVHHLEVPWEGLAALVETEYERVHADPKGEAMEHLLADLSCPECQGDRIASPGRDVRFHGLRLPELARLSATEARAWLQGLDLDGAAAFLRGDLVARLGAMEEAGLGHLAPDREMATLSGGEAQRLRLASSLASGLSGVTYVLDEPTRGLHPRDTARLAGVLEHLAEAGNAVVVVEHDPALVSRADHILELGPGAGPDGGHLMAAGAPASFPPDSYTGRLLAPGVLPPPRAARPGPGLELRGARLHNLKGLDVTFPSGVVVAVTGVSGSGKSTLVRGVLGASLQAAAKEQDPVGAEALLCHVPVDRVECLNQEPAGSGGGSTVATAAGLAEALRRRFAATPRARELKLAAKHFSTASPGGRCEACEGKGTLTVAMDFLPDVVVGCEACGGQGFQGDVLSCLVGGRTIAQMLRATVDEALEVFGSDRTLGPLLKALSELGLGYLALGQGVRSLSGGEAQRLRLADLLREEGPGRVALLLDEPSRGLGAADVARLVAALRHLADRGHVVVVVEHDLDFIRAADWVLDLGPGGGPEGGRLVVSGTPETVAACKASFTGQALVRR
jgi:excinuclease ABC subunit A